MAVASKSAQRFLTPFVIASGAIQTALEQEAAAELPPEPEQRPRSVYEWALKHRRIDGRPFSLRRFEPNRAAYQDDHPHIVIGKPAQRGWSEYALNATMFALDQGAAVWTHEPDCPLDESCACPDAKQGLNVGYVMPNDKVLSEFSKERISGMEEESPHLAGMFRAQREFNAVGFKQVGQSYLYLRGGQTVENLTSFPADFIVLDEFDRLPEAAPALARRRMNASVVGREIDISTPTIPGFGIHAAWLLSDQREYEQAHSCGAGLVFDFFEHVTVNGYAWEDWRYWPAERINVSTVQLICPSCGDPVTEDERTAPGRWVARQEGSDLTRGYWAPALAYPMVELKRYALNAIKEQPTEIEEFFRQDLGKPYDTGGTRINREMLAALSAELDNGLLPNHTWIQTCMGIDVGGRLHYSIDSKSKQDGEVYVREMGAVREPRELYEIIDRMKPRMIVMDALPETRITDRLVARYPGRAAGAIYPEGALAIKGTLYAPDKDKILASGRVNINRTMALDEVLAAISGQHEHWPARIHNDPEVIEHMIASQRVTVLNKRGEPRNEWVHTRPDHYMHARAYCQVARRILDAKGKAGGGLGVASVGGARDSRLARGRR